MTAYVILRELSEHKHELVAWHEASNPDHAFKRCGALPGGIYRLLTIESASAYQLNRPVELVLRGESPAAPPERHAG